MIKVIALDLVGVLVREKDIKLTAEESKIEKMFGPNKSDIDFLQKVKNLMNTDTLLEERVQTIIDKIYEVREPKLFIQLKKKYNDIKIVIATNHVSFVKKFIRKNMQIEYLDDIYISAEIQKIKPEITFYEHLISKLKIKNKELLFLDDSQVNINVAKKLGIKTIKIDKEMNLYDTITKWFEQNNE